MADAPANRTRIVPIMADHNYKPSPVSTEPKTRPKGRPPTKKATAAPKPAPSGRTTRSQTKALGLDAGSANLKTLEVRGLYAFETKGDGTDNPILFCKHVFFCRQMIKPNNVQAIAFTMLSPTRCTAIGITLPRYAITCPPT